MRHFGPPERPAYLEQLRPEIVRIVTTLLDQLQGQRQIDLVERFNYPLPVTVICRILGVPREDEPQFQVWASALIENLAEQSEAAGRRRDQAQNDLNQYMAGAGQAPPQTAGRRLLSRWRPRRSRRTDGGSPTRRDRRLAADRRARDDRESAWAMACWRCCAIRRSSSACGGSRS